MSKKEKKPLSKAVGEWDNGFSDREKVDYTYNEIRNAFLADRRYNRMMRVNQLQLILRGSASKNSANADSDDIDIHCNFNYDVDLCDEKDNVEAVLINRFGEDYVQRHIKSIVVLPKKKRLKVDLIVCRQGDGEVIALNDNTNKEETFFTPDEQSLIGKLDSSCNGNFTKMVRTFKRLRHLVYQATGKKYYITSHAIECMLFSIRKKIYRTKYDRNAEVDMKKRFLAVVHSVGAKLKNVKHYGEIKEINGQKQLFKENQQYKVFVEFWNDLHDYLVANYDFEK